MAVVDIQSELAARNPNAAKDHVANALAAIDESITMLGLAVEAGSIGENEAQLIRGLYFIHRRLRTECDRLFKLL